MAADSAGGTSDVNKVLSYGTRVRLVGWAMVGICMPLSIFFMLSLSHVRPGQIPIILCGAVIFLGLPLMLLAEFYRVKISFDDHAIYTRSPWRPARTIPWKEINSCNYSASNRWYAIRTANHGTIRVSDLLSGKQQFLTELKRRTNLG
jgi:hypothetical protein